MDKKIYNLILSFLQKKIDIDEFDYQISKINTPKIIELKKMLENFESIESFRFVNDITEQDIWNKCLEILKSEENEII